MRAISVEFAGGDLRRFDGLDAPDLAAPGFFLGFDPVDRDFSFLSDARRLDGLARGDLGFFDRAGAGDVERADALFLLDARCGGYFSRRNVAFLQCAGPFDFQRPRRELRRDAIGGQGLFPCDAGGFGRPCGGDLFLVDGAVARDLAAADFLFQGDALLGDDALLRDACALGRLARGDLGLLQIACALDFEPPVFLLLADARYANGELLGDARFLGLLAGRDLGLLDIALPLDLAALIVLLAGDPRLGKDALLGDARTLDPFARGNLGLVDLAAALDLAFANVALGNDARFGQGSLVRNSRLFDLFPAGDLGLFRLGVAQRAFAGELGALHGAPHFDVALLIEAGSLAFAIDFERLLLGFKVAAADQDHRFLLDVVAQLAPRLDVLDQLGQAFGVEAVRRIEEFEIGLVEIGDRHGFELEPVLLQPFQRQLLHPGDVFAAPFVHFLHGHFGGDRA